MKKPSNTGTNFDAFRARQKYRSGPHMVLTANGLKAGQSTTRKGTEFRSLTQARKASNIGDAIVRVRDGIVVSVR